MPSDLELVLDALDHYRTFLQNEPTCDTGSAQFSIESLTDFERELKNYAFEALSDLSIHLRLLKA